MTRRDRVTPEMALATFSRDGGCVAPRLGAESPCWGRLTLDHVRDQPMMGKRAPSDMRHLVSLCWHHHLDGWATSHRPALRGYLGSVSAIMSTVGISDTIWNRMLNGPSIADTSRGVVALEVSAPMTRFCVCGRALSERATNCRWCRPYSTRPLAERFWEKVDKSGDCWLWTGRPDGRMGYGRIREGVAGSATLLAHRVAWELAFGPVPAGLDVCHTCDIPLCVRPDHLFLGTTLDNMADAKAKGRMATGDRWYAARPLLRRRTA